jgi:hypothetical protein
VGVRGSPVSKPWIWGTPSSKPWIRGTPSSRPWIRGTPSSKPWNVGTPISKKDGKKILSFVTGHMGIEELKKQGGFVIPTRRAGHAGRKKKETSGVLQQGKNVQYNP